MGLQMPATQTLASEIVPPEFLSNAVHLNVVAFQAARAGGPLLAGLILVTWGPGWAFAIDAASFLFAFTTLLLVRTTRRQRSQVTAIAGRGVFRQVWATPGIAIGVVLTATVSLLGPPVVQLSTLLADQVFHVNANGYGRLLAAYGVGSFVGALLLSLLAHRHQRSSTIIATVIGFGASLMLLGSVDSYVVGIFAMTACGICFSISLGSLNSGIQEASPDSSRGRTVALYLIVLNGGAAVGALVGGWMSDVMSATTVVAINGVLLAAVGIVCLMRPTLRQLDRAQSR